MVWAISTGGTWDVAGNWVNEANPADHHVPNSSDNAVIDVPGNVTVTYQGSPPTVLTVQNDDTIWVNGSSAGGNAVLSVSQGVTNDGTILLESSNATYASDIATGSNTLTNVGTIEVSLGSGVSQVAVTLSELVNVNTFIPSAITLVGPSGVIAVDQPQFVSGTTYGIGSAAQAAQGAYKLTIAPTVEDLAGNEMDQEQNGINGGPDDSFTGSFAIALPDLAVTATQAPSSALLGEGQDAAPRHP